MKKYFYCLASLCLCVGCQKVDNSHVIEVDLSETGTEIVYSQFVDSVDIKTLNLPDSLPINGVEYLYFDDNKVFIKDSGNEGIFIFDERDGNLLGHVNSFGEGPKEIKRISSFCLDSYQKRLCIFDSGDMKLKMYDYWGNYISSSSVNDFFIDMVKLENNSMTYFYPIYADKMQPDGVWISDTLNCFIKQLSSRVTEDCKFHYFPMQYNWNGVCAYYYDRNWDELSVVTADSIFPLYTFHLHQAIPMSKRGTKNLSPRDLDNHSIVHYFAYSDRFLLLSFHTFHQRDMQRKDITWMLFDKKTGEKVISKGMRNDLKPDSEIDNYSLFYKDNHTWVRVDDSLDAIIRLEFLYLR